MERKGLRGSELKTTGEGEVVAVIATFNVIDSDGDVTLPGAFGEQPVPMVYGHDWGGLPIGKGRIFEEAGRAVFEGKFNLNISDGREAFESVKFQDDLQDWSYGFSLRDGGSKYGTFEGKNVRFLQPNEKGDPGISAHEVSPVLVGAGVGTGTLALKEGKLRFVEHAEAVVTAFDVLVDRAQGIIDLREGKSLGTDSLERLTEVAERFNEVKETLDSILRGPAPEVADMTAEFVRYQQSVAKLNGVTY